MWAWGEDGVSDSREKAVGSGTDWRVDRRQVECDEARDAWRSGGGRARVCGSYPWSVYLLDTCWHLCQFYGLSMKCPEEFAPRAGELSGVGAGPLMGGVHLELRWPPLGLGPRALLQILPSGSSGCHLSNP